MTRKRSQVRLLYRPPWTSLRVRGSGICGLAEFACLGVVGGARVDLLVPRVPRCRLVGAAVRVQFVLGRDKAGGRGPPASVMGSLGCSGGARSLVGVCFGVVPLVPIVHEPSWVEFGAAAM